MALVRAEVAALAGAIGGISSGKEDIPAGSPGVTSVATVAEAIATEIVTVFAAGVAATVDTSEQGTMLAEIVRSFYEGRNPSSTTATDYDDDCAAIKDLYVAGKAATANWA